MTVLLTNDDGYQSDGLAAARNALLGAGLQVVTVAPDGPRSGGSRAATFRRPVRFDQVNDDVSNPVYACDGTPVDCIRVALMSDLAPDAKVVVSGINEGANLGDDTTYSSTVGAAIEGALLGIGSVAISQQSRDRRFRLVDREGYNWDAAGTVIAELAAGASAEPLPARTLVNVNVPGATRLAQPAWCGWADVPTDAAASNGAATNTATGSSPSTSTTKPTHPSTTRQAPTSRRSPRVRSR